MAADTVAEIRIQLHAGGGMSISGNIGDTTLALAMIDHARDAVKSQRAPKAELVLPHYDVAAPQSPAFPTREMGDMLPAERGDML